MNIAVEDFGKKWQFVDDFAVISQNNQKVGFFLGSNFLNGMNDEQINDLIEDLEMLKNKEKLVKKFEDSSKSGLSDLKI